MTAPDSFSSDISPEKGVSLNSFERDERRRALEEIAKELRSGSLVRPPARDVVNNHIHTFYSYCSMNLSPYGVVWEALRRGLSVVGSADFDVLDAMDEMYEAGDALGVKATVSLETRAFAEGYATREINSPGEPGVVYAMGVGFAEIPSAPLFASLAEQSRRRNEEMIAKVDPVLAPASIDYQDDVLPLTPGGNATERHICAAYDAMARRAFPDSAGLAAFWSDRLGLPPDKAAALLEDAGSLRNAIRAKFMKQGGVGYAKPDRDTFPAAADFFRMVSEAGAIPCLAWLDGLSAGEANADALLDDFMAMGVGAVNIIPERNWNIADPALKQRKLEALERFVRAAQKRRLPVLAGTELNGPGQKFVDSFDAPELAPYTGEFIKAGHWLYGHTLLARAAGMGAASAWAAARFASDRARAYAFYAEVGKIAAPGTLPDGLSEDMAPEDVLERLRL